MRTSASKKICNGIIFTCKGRQIQENKDRQNILNFQSEQNRLVKDAVWEVTSRNVSKGPTEKDNGGCGGGGRLNEGVGVGRTGESNGGKMGKTVIEQQ